MAYVEETLRLRENLAKDYWNKYGIGFMRFRRIMRKDAEVHTARWESVDVLEQNLLEELPYLRPICLGNGSTSVPYIQAEGNTHQALWILPRDQIEMFNRTCGFLLQASASREYMSSLSIFHNFFFKGSNCQMDKIIPAQR